METPLIPLSPTMPSGLAYEMMHRVLIEEPQREECRMLIACGAFEAAEDLYGSMAHEPEMGMPPELTAEFQERVAHQAIVGLTTCALNS